MVTDQDVVEMRKQISELRDAAQQSDQTVTDLQKTVTRLTAHGDACDEAFSKFADALQAHSRIIERQDREIGLLKGAIERMTGAKGPIPARGSLN